MNQLANATVIVFVCAGIAVANVSPDTPTITEPSLNGQIVNPQDVHMETTEFSDADVGDGHLCSDWEIWTITPNERVWVLSCIGGVERLHTHLADGTFENSHVGRLDLEYDRDYRVRARHRDDSGDAGTDWSGWAERFFTTGSQTSVFPLDLDDILDAPTPQWTDTTTNDVILPGGGTPPSVRIESASGGLILEFRGLDGVMNLVTNPAALSEHEPARVVADPGSTGSNLTLPESDITFFNDENEEITVYLPVIDVAPSQQAVYWISANGSTYVGQIIQTLPDFSQLARGAPVPWIASQTGFKVEVVASGFQLPVNIAFVPNPSPTPGAPLYYVAELYGQIKVVANDGTVSDYATGLLNYSPTGNFPGSGEQGLAGIAVDPITGDVYASMLYDAGGPHYPKVDRFQSVDGGLTASTQTTILDMAGESQGQSHQISNVSIGPDGKLYVHMGDGFVASTGQDLDSYRGKILRLNLDGSAPTDNPFYDAGNGINSRDYVFAYGLRNPFGGAWRSADGFHYQVENGPSRDRFAKVINGQNYLWDGSNQSMENFALHVWNPSTGPVNLAFIQSDLFGGSGFPASKLDHAFVTESGPTWATGPQSNGKRITEYVLDASGNLIGGPTNLVTYGGTGKATACALAAGPDGLYFSELYKDQDYSSPIDTGANILRVRFVGDANFTADVTNGSAPLAVQFTDTSNVPSPSLWEWDFGDCTTSTQQNPAKVYDEEGVYNVQLRVTGSGGVRVAYKSAYIQVGQTVDIALIGGTIPHNAADSAIADHLRNQGYVVDAFDDEPANRPTAHDLAHDYDLVIVSSTTLSSNIAGDFRTETVPLIYWENALNRVDRVPLTDNGGTVSDSTIDLVNNSHPVSTGLASGVNTVFTPSDTMSVARGNVASGTDVLATRDGVPGDITVMTADAGAQLLGGHVAPARRVFLFYEDSSWLNASSEARQLLDQAVLWTAGPASTTLKGDMDRDGDVDVIDAPLFADALINSTHPAGCAPERIDINGDGLLDGNDVACFVDCVLLAGCP